MEVFDRSLETIMEHVIHITGCRKTKGAEHVARAIQLLQAISSLCTYLNKHSGKDSAGGKCSFYTRERDAGLNEHSLFQPLDPDMKDDVDWDMVPQRKYWNVFLMLILQNVAKKPSETELHDAAIRIQFIAIKPLAACIQRQIKKSFCDSVAGKVLVQHLAALTGPAINSSVETIDASDFSKPLHRATSADVKDTTENEDIEVHDATLIHLMFFAGPVENMAPQARKAYCATLTDITSKHGADVAEIINAAAVVANDSIHRVILPLKCNPSRRDYVLDETLFMHVVKLLTGFRTFIEYEKLL